MVDDVVKCSSHIPKTNVSTSNNTVPGWSEHVKPYKDEVIFWKRQWDQLGQPPQGLVAHYMRRSRADYHYAIRYVWQNEKSLKQQNFLTSMLKGGRDFHSEIKKIKACTQTIPKCVNGKSEPTEIAELFAEKKKIYIFNSNPSNKNDIETLMSHLHCRITSNSGSINHAIITKDEVDKAIKVMGVSVR